MKLQSTAAEVSYRKGIHYIGVKPIIDFVSEKKCAISGHSCFVLLLRRLGHLGVREGGNPPLPHLLLADQIIKMT